LLVHAQLGAAAVCMNTHEAKCNLLIARHPAAILYIASTANICSCIDYLRLCSSAEAEIDLNLFLNFE